MGFERHDREKVLAGALATALGRLAGLINGVFIFAIPALVGDAAFGAFMVVYFAMELLGSLLVSGFADAAIYFGARRLAAADEDGMYRALAHCVAWPLLIAVGLSVAIGVSAPVLYATVWADEWSAEMVSLLTWGATVLPLMVLVKLAYNAIKIHLDMRWPVLVGDVIIPLTSFTLVLLGWALDLGAVGLVWAYVGSYLVALPIALYGYTRHFEIGRTLRAVPRGLREREMASFAWLQGTNKLFVYGLGRVDTLMLSYWFGPEVISVYSRLTELPRAIETAKTAFDGVFSPLVAKYKELGNRRGMQDSLHLISRWTAAVAFPLLIVLLSFYPEVIAMELGARWEHSVWLVWLLTVGPMVSCFFGLAGNLLLMTGHARLSLLNATLAMALNVALNLALIPVWGPVGAAVATMVSALVLHSLQVAELSKVEGTHFALSSFVKPLVGGVPCAVVVFQLNQPGSHALLFSSGVAAGTAIKATLVLGCLALYAAMIFGWPGANPERAWLLDRVAARRGAA